MEVSIIENGEVIWMRNATTSVGVACTNYLKDGTQQKIIAALEEALSQAKSEMLSWNDTDGMFDVCTTSAKI